MKTTLILALTASAAFAQGPLTPPGPPAATGKSLTEIYDRTEKRTPVSALPFTISQPGSYYLTDNLSGVGAASGIAITSGNVTLDLNGFTLDGGNAATPAIATIGGISQVTVRNGHITLWNAVGLDLSTASNVAVEKITVRAAGGKGIRTGYYSTVSDCRVDEVGAAAYDIGSQSTVRNCVAGRSTGEGFLLGEDVNAEQLVVHQTLGPATHGIRLEPGASVSHAVIRSTTGNGILGLDRTTVRDSTIESTAGTGVYVGEDGTISGCDIRNAAGGGIIAWTGSRVISCVVSQPTGTGIHLGETARGEKLQVRGTPATGIGILVGQEATATECTVATSGGYGFRAYNRARLSGCSAIRCGAFGFYASELVVIERCHANSNNSGGYSIGSDCVISKSSAITHRNPAWTDFTNRTAAWPAVHFRGEGNNVAECEFSRNDIVYRAVSSLHPDILGHNQSSIVRCTATLRTSPAVNTPILHDGAQIPTHWFPFGRYAHERTSEETHFDNANTYIPVHQ